MRLRDASSSRHASWMRSNAPRVPPYLMWLVQVQCSGEPVPCRPLRARFPVRPPLTGNRKDDERARHHPGMDPSAERCHPQRPRSAKPDTSASWSSCPAMTPRPADGSPQDRLVERDLQPNGSGRPPDERLGAPIPDMNAAADLLLAHIGIVPPRSASARTPRSAECRGTSSCSYQLSWEAASSRPM